MKEEPIQPDPDETADDETTGDETGGDETGGDEASRGDGDATRLASEEELADLARLLAKVPRRRTFVFSTAIVLLLGVLATLIAILFGRHEKSITWPGEQTEDFHDERRLLHVDDGTALLVYWPGGPRDVVSGDGTNLIDVVTAVGRHRNVPFHLHVTCETLTNGLRVTTRDSFEDWKRARVQEDWSFYPTGERLVFLNAAESGYPAWSVDYVRGNTGSMLSGRALYIRHIDREIVVLREFSIADCGRAQKLLDNYACVAANLAAVRARFEIPAEREPGDPHKLINEAYGALQKGFLASDWRQLDRTLRTVILTARENGDKKLLQNASLLYSTFRMKVQNWYVRECLNFQLLNSSKRDIGIREKVRAEGRTSIRRECAVRLPDESDSRQQRIANDDWSLP